MNVIKLRGINKVYRTKEIETQALENVNVEVKKGEFLSIMGPSGCGKSTLLNIVGLLDLPTSGSVEICGTTADDFRMYRSPDMNAVCGGNVGATTLEGMERISIKNALEKYNNNISMVARELGISRAALYRRIEKYKLKI